MWRVWSVAQRAGRGAGRGGSRIFPFFRRIAHFHVYHCREGRILCTEQKTKLKNSSIQLRTRYFKFYIVFVKETLRNRRRKTIFERGKIWQHGALARSFPEGKATIFLVQTRTAKKKIAHTIPAMLRWLFLDVKRGKNVEYLRK